MLKFIPLLSALTVCGCGDGVTFGRNLIGGGEHRYEEYWVSDSDSFDEVDLTKSDNNRNGVDVDGGSYFGLIMTEETADGRFYTVGPDELMETDGVAWYATDDSTVARGQIFVDMNLDNGEGNVGRQGEGRFEYAYECGSAWGSSFDCSEDICAAPDKIHGDYAVIMETDSGDFYTNLSGWKVNGGVFSYAQSEDGLPPGLYSYCDGTIYIYADPPEEDSDPWDD